MGKAIDVVKFVNDPELNRAVQYLSDLKTPAIDIEVIYQNNTFNVATDPSADILPAVARTVYLLSVNYNTSTISGWAGNALIELYAPFVAAINKSLVVFNATSAWLTVPQFVSFDLCSRLRWNDNGATVGIYDVRVIGYKITY